MHLCSKINIRFIFIYNNRRIRFGMSESDRTKITPSISSEKTFELHRRSFHSTMYDSTKKMINDVTNNIKHNIKNILPDDKLKKTNTTNTIDATNVISTTDIKDISKIPLDLGIRDFDQYFSQFPDSVDLEDVKIEEIKVSESETYLDSTIVPNKQLDQLLQDVTNIKEISMDMAGMLDVQNKKLQKIDDHTTSASIHIEEGSKELDKATKYRNDGVINMAGVTGGAIVGSLFGPIGAATGALVGFVSSVAVNKLR